MTSNQLPITVGNRHNDERGIITFNNEFDASEIKRIYTIENHTVDFIRGWQGHKIEQRWFASMNGKFKISVIEVDNFENPSQDLTIQQYILDDESLTYLHIPAGHLTAIQALQEESKLLVLADFCLGEVQDEYRFPIDYFKNKK
ncbi:WxcM-like domain-containing protein [Empedobacter sp.]|uniref:WxcM-like domain-containing protein n=1 Tax=Empedobacter sp. TaxID=1927715 RepID=UPI0028AF43FA|nr:WxcM-like domain-containing protein [Empedobacter sp.]